MEKKMEDRTPLTAYWTAIKSKNPDLSKNPAFKPDINGPIKTYDAGMLQYVKLMQDRDKLMDLFPAYAKSGADLTNKIIQQCAELEKVMDQDQAEVTKAVTALDAEVDKKEDADPAKISSLLSDVCTQSEQMVTSRKQIWERLSKLGEDKVAGNKKLRDEYKAKATTIASGMKKVEDDTIKLEAQIRGIISAYQKVAINLDKDDIADAVRELLGRF